MKKIIALCLGAILLTGCASGPEKGYYDEQGVYHPSKDAVNSDRMETAGAVALGAAAVAGLTMGIIAVTKWIKATWSGLFKTFN